MAKTAEKPIEKEETAEDRALRMDARRATLRDKPEPTAEQRERTEQEIIADSRKALAAPLMAGQRLFESPEGFVMVGEASEDRMWCRWANKGKGAWINPYRGGNVAGLAEKKRAQQRGGK